MAVCNLFNNLTNTSGNFLMFSQYVEDLTRNNSNGDNYKVVPSKFIAFDIDYSTVENPNYNIPRYFQNYFENGCAVGKTINNINNEDFKWNPEYTKNLFWYSMCENGFINIGEVIPNGNDNSNENVGYIKEAVYCGDINMHSYNEHQGMGYSEIYCYIPSDAKKSSIQLSKTIEIKQIISTDNNYLEGTNITNNYNKAYCYTDVYKLDYSNIKKYSDSKYDINTIVVLYSIYVKENDNWK